MFELLYNMNIWFSYIIVCSEMYGESNLVYNNCI